MKNQHTHSGTTPEDGCLWRAATICRSARFISTTNPLLKAAAETVAREAAGGRTLGHDAGQNFIYVH